MENKQLDFLRKSIEEKINKIDGRRVYYRKQAFNLYISTSIISAITTILLGLKITNMEEFVRIAALVMTTLITVINTYNAFFNNKELWIANNTAKNKLNRLQFYIDYLENGEDPITKEIIGECKNTYQEILDELNSTWQKNRLQEKAQVKTG